MLRGIRNLRLKAALSGESGATAIEFSIILLPLILLTVGTIDLGRLYWTRNALNDVAIAGARCAAINAPPCVDFRTNPNNARDFIQKTASQRAITLEPSSIVLGLSEDQNYVLVRINISYRWSIRIQTDLTVEALHVIQGRFS
jgi:Flp pilus assembly protein TadG